MEHADDAKAGRRVPSETMNRASCRQIHCTQKRVVRFRDVSTTIHNPLDLSPLQ